jgi:hypothetical protein
VISSSFFLYHLLHAGGPFLVESGALKVENEKADNGT